jgi:hypothetical protein
MMKTPALRVLPEIRDYARTFAIIVKCMMSIMLVRMTRFPFRALAGAKPPIRAGYGPGSWCANAPFYRVVPCMQA